jgi:glycogen synthase
VHVLVTADTVGGVWTYTRELVCGLLNRGHRVTLVSFGRLPSDSQKSWMQHNRLTFHATSFPLEWMRDAQPGITESARHLQRIISDSKPDLLHFNQYCYGALECGIPKLVVAHSDVVSWWNAVHGTDPPASPWMEWYRNIVSRGLRCADIVVAPSKWMLDTVCEHYPGRFNGCVIYNGRSPSLFRPSTEKQNCVLAVGRIWDEAKDIRLLLARKQRVPVTIAGSAEHPDKSVDGATDLSGQENLTICGEQDETQLRQLYSSCSIYAATSRYEPFGLAPVEAALSKCALIANDIPSFRELWGDSALFFRRNDPDALADAIATFAEHPPLRRLYAEEAYERARSRFNSQRMVDEYESLYKILVRGGRVHEYAAAA